MHDEEPLFKDLPFESDVRIQSLVAVAVADGRLHRSEEINASRLYRHEGEWNEAQFACVW